MRTTTSWSTWVTPAGVLRIMPSPSACPGCVFGRKIARMGGLRGALCALSILFPLMMGCFQGSSDAPAGSSSVENPVLVTAEAYSFFTPFPTPAGFPTSTPLPVVLVPMREAPRPTVTVVHSGVFVPVPSVEPVPIPSVEPGPLPAPSLVAVPASPAPASSVPGAAPGSGASSREILGRMLESMVEVDTGRIDSLVTSREMGPAEPLDFTTHSFGDFREPGVQHVMVETFRGGVLEETKDVVFVSLGYYVSEPGSEVWVPVEGDPFFGLKFGDLSNAGFGVEDLSSLELVGREELYGEDVYHIRGQVPGHIAAVFLGQRAGAFIPGVVDYWVGASDHLLRLMRSETRMTWNGSRYWMTMAVTLSDHNMGFNMDIPGMHLDALDPSLLETVCHDEGEGRHCH